MPFVKLGIKQLVEKLARSAIYRDYVRAFSAATGMPLALRSVEHWQQALRGGVMLALVFITPLLGSLFLLHVGLASGFGVFLLARPWKSPDQPVNILCMFRCMALCAIAVLSVDKL